jgi:hypothetical protein
VNVSAAWEREGSLTGLIPVPVISLFIKMTPMSLLMVLAS